MKNKDEIFKDLKEKTEALQKQLSEYPEKDIAEYTRVMDALDIFLKYGIWEDYADDSDE